MLLMNINDPIECESLDRSYYVKFVSRRLKIFFFLVNCKIDNVLLERLTLFIQSIRTGVFFLYVQEFYALLSIPTGVFTPDSN